MPDAKSDPIVSLTLDVERAKDYYSALAPALLCESAAEHALAMLANAILAAWAFITKRPVAQ